MSSLQLLKEQTKQLTSFLDRLGNHNDLENKLTLLQEQESTQDFLKQDHPIAAFFPQLNEIERVLIENGLYLCS